jgi:hypothetical protein
MVVECTYAAICRNRTHKRYSCMMMCVCVCMYVCVHACMCACMHVCVCVLRKKRQQQVVCCLCMYPALCRKWRHKTWVLRNVCTCVYVFVYVCVLAHVTCMHACVSKYENCQTSTMQTHIHIYRVTKCFCANLSKPVKQEHTKYIVSHGYCDQCFGLPVCVCVTKNRNVRSAEAGQYKHIHMPIWSHRVHIQTCTAIKYEKENFAWWPWPVLSMAYACV